MKQTRVQLSSGKGSRTGPAIDLPHCACRGADRNSFSCSSCFFVFSYSSHWPRSGRYGRRISGWGRGGRREREGGRDSGSASHRHAQMTQRYAFSGMAFTSLPEIIENLDALMTRACGCRLSLVCAPSLCLILGQRKDPERNLFALYLPFRHALPISPFFRRAVCTL